MVHQPTTNEAVTVAVIGEAMAIFLTAVDSQKTSLSTDMTFQDVRHGF